MRYQFPLRLCSSIALFLFTAGAVSCGDRADPGSSLDISGPWKIILADDRKAAAPFYDDTGAGTVTIPGEWVGIIRKQEEMAFTVWLRKSVFIGGALSGSNLVLELGEIGIADEVYFNGVFIGGTGGIPDGQHKLDYRFAWKIPRHYAIPEPLVRYDRTNSISIRVFSHVFNGITGRQRIVARQNEYPDHMPADYFPILINVFALSLNSVFFFIFLAQYLANRKEPVYMLFALVVLSAALLNLCVTGIPLHLNGLVRMKALLFAYTSISFFISLAMQEIFSVRYRYSAAVLLSALCLITVCMGAAPTTRVLVVYCGFAAVIAVLSCQVYSSFVFMVSVTRDLRRYWLLLFIVPIVFSAFRNAYFLLAMRFSEVYGSIFLHVPVLIVIATLFFFYDYEYQKRCGESIYQSLLKKSQKLQRDLDKAKKIDAKPEPHELIFGLITHLDENFSETYDRKELSKRFGLNSNYMVQLFKRTTGDTISNYINRKRIESAKQLLRDGDNKIIDIAFHVGFENYTHFHRLFKRSTGMTPREYRLYAGD